MNTGKLLTFGTTVAVIVAVALFVYLVNASRALSYLSHDPKACINCHVMNTQYATWQHSSHARRATCIECHLPTKGFFNKYAAKMRDGWNHSTAFTFNTFKQRIQISDNGADRVQANCVSCHAVLVSRLLENSDRYHDFNKLRQTDKMRCWDCHRDVPHGGARGLTATPYNLGVRELK
jgi:cytochrome c nitrite reductase small subunit